MAIIPPAAMGRVKNIRKLPSDKSNDCLSEFSNIGPKTKARTIGAASKLYFRIKYPSTPQKSITVTSKVLLLTLKAPIKQNKNIIGKRIL